MPDPYAPPKSDEVYAPRPEYPPTYGAFTAAGILFVLDTVVVNQGVLAVVGSAITLLFVLVGRARPLFFQKLVVVLAVTPAVWGTNILQNELARHRATAVIAAVEAYEHDRGSYPARLEDLVPRYMPSVPRAKFTLMGEFHYDNFEHPTLWWVDLPPFGRPFYSFPDKRWGYLD